MQTQNRSNEDWCLIHHPIDRVSGRINAHVAPLHKHLSPTPSRVWIIWDNSEQNNCKCGLIGAVGFCKSAAHSIQHERSSIHKCIHVSRTWYVPAAKVNFATGIWQSGKILYEYHSNEEKKTDLEKTHTHTHRMMEHGTQFQDVTNCIP